MKIGSVVEIFGPGVHRKLEKNESLRVVCGGVEENKSGFGLYRTVSSIGGF